MLQYCTSLCTSSGGKIGKLCGCYDHVSVNAAKVEVYHYWNKILRQIFWNTTLFNVASHEYIGTLKHWPLVINHISVFILQTKDLSSFVDADQCSIAVSQTTLQSQLKSPSRDAGAPVQLPKRWNVHVWMWETSPLYVSSLPSAVPPHVPNGKFLSEPEPDKDLSIIKQLCLSTWVSQKILARLIHQVGPDLIFLFSGSRNVERISEFTEAFAGISFIMSPKTGMRPNHNFRRHPCVFMTTSDWRLISIVRTIPLPSFLEFRILHATVLILEF